MLNSEDIKLLDQKGIAQEALADQIDRFKEGFDSLELAAAATVK